VLATNARSVVRLLAFAGMESSNIAWLLGFVAIITRRFAGKLAFGHAQRHHHPVRKGDDWFPPHPLSRRSRW
jgi:hypothetical protein